ncbi:MAG: DNA primase [Candidatus Saganbacteria bacterium]|nr:DNA primase [Candidatus Saganbacteria bacterium]
MIDKNIIEDIRSKADIVSIVSDYVALKKRGKNYLALCPFHSEKTASFTVSQEKQLFHCFGCSEGGNVFSFIMKIENISFKEAAKLLADKLGIPLEIDARPQDPQGTKDQKIFEIISSALEFYELELKISETALAYVQKRGLDKQALSTFRIGYSPDSWDKTYRFLTSKGYLPKDIELAGLILKKEGSNSYYDRFRNRLMFPIFDAKGRALGFGARSMDGGDPKYLNSPDSPVYNKGNVLFGLNFSKEHIREKRCALIMEGYMDVISAFSAGFDNVVASSGTSVTINQVKSLQRLTDNITLVFDSDAAGSQATERSIDILKEIGIYPKVAVLSGGKDPDEIITKEGKEKFSELLNKAVPWLAYKLGAVLKKNDISSPEGKSKALKEAAAILSKEKDNVIRSEYSKNLSRRLNVDEDHVLSAIKDSGYYSTGDFRGRRGPIKKPLSKIDEAEKTIIKLCLEDTAGRDNAMKDLTADDFSCSVNREIFEKLPPAGADMGEDRLPVIVDALATEEAKKAFSAIIFDDHEIMDREKTLQDCINTLKSNALKIRIDGLKRRMSEAEKANDLAGLAALQEEFKKCHNEIRSF